MSTSGAIGTLLGELEPTSIHNLFDANKHTLLRGIEFDPNAELVTVELLVGSYGDTKSMETYWVVVTPARAASLKTEQFCFIRVDDGMTGLNSPRTMTIDLFNDGTVFVPLLPEKPA